MRRVPWYGTYLHWVVPCCGSRLHNHTLSRNRNLKVCEKSRHQFCEAGDVQLSNKLASCCFGTSSEFETANIDRADFEWRSFRNSAYFKMFNAASVRNFTAAWRGPPARGFPSRDAFAFLCPESRTRITGRANDVTSSFHSVCFTLRIIAAIITLSIFVPIPVRLVHVQLSSLCVTV